jgi:heat shock protein HslJ
VLILSSDEKELARFAKADRTPKEDKAPQMSFNEALGKTWVLAELNGAAINVMEPPSLTFTEDRVEGYSGVNRLGGSYERVESRLTFGPIRSTRRAGSPDQIKLENQFMKILTDVDGYELTGQQLSLLVGKDVVAKFVLETP